MKTTAVRMYGAMDVRMEEFELPAIREDEILVKVVSDSICMSTYKCVVLGQEHRRVLHDIKDRPVIIGHEFAGDIVQVGEKHRERFRPGMRFAIQPALNYQGSIASPGYSYEYLGGDCTYCVLTPEVMLQDCLLEYTGEGYYQASLAEPMSCIIGAFHASYHTKAGSYVHEMGTKPRGTMALLGAAGPMGLGAIDYALHGGPSPRLLVVTDINEERLERARQLFSVEEAAALGTQLIFVNTAENFWVAEEDVGGTMSGKASSNESVCVPKKIADDLKAFNEGRGYDDVFVFAPVSSVIETGAEILGQDGCLNFFAGPTDSQLSAWVNMYDVHYNGTHFVGTSGGNTEDMREALALCAEKKLNPAVMITHIGGLDAAGEATKQLPDLPGGKKLIYTHIRMPLTAISDFEQLGKQDHRFARLAQICREYNGLWSAEAEAYLLEAWELV